MDVYDVSGGPGLNRLVYCSDIPAVVLQLDFSADSAHIQVGSRSLACNRLPSMTTHMCIAVCRFPRPRISVRCLSFLQGGC